MNRKRLREGIIRIKIRDITDGVTLVKEHLPDSEQEFRKLGLVRDGIYKRIEFAIEDVFDICAILNTDLGLGVPGEDDDILVHLVQADIITSGMHEKIKGMRGFRNIVVHRYGTIDDTLAFHLLKENIEDFSLFTADVETILERYR